MDSQDQGIPHRGVRFDRPAFAILSKCWSKSKHAVTDTDNIRTERRYRVKFSQSGVGVEESNSLSAFEVYLNPTSGMINITLADAVNGNSDMRLTKQVIR